MNASSSLRLLALDFDGVISDSAPESFVVALRTSVALGASPRSAAALKEFRELCLADILVHPLYRDFLALMPLGNRAEDFGVALRSLEEGRTIEGQAGYDDYRGSLESGFLERFHECFYRERATLSAADPVSWISLMAPYPSFVDLLQRRAPKEPGQVQLAIATAKDRSSVVRLLRAYELDLLFHPSRVVDKEAGRSKREHLRCLQSRLGCEFHEITFVDDKLNHLIDVAALGVRPVLAAWGYNTERERRGARALGFGVCDLGDADDVLFPRLSATPPGYPGATTRLR